jgi:replicative DNA helicase
MTGEDWKRFYQGASVYLDASRLAAEALEYRCQITFDESPDVNVNHIRSTARRWAAVQERARVERQARGALVSPHRGLIVVDYAQLVAPLPHEKGRRDVMRHEQIGEVSRGLKSLSKQLEMPVLALAALNRDLEKRENKRPILSDLRECGQLEADADVVLFLYRASEYEDDADPEIAEVIIGKHRGGAKGTVRLRFNAAEIAFSDFDENDPRGHAPAGAAARTNGHGRRPRRGRGSFAALSAVEDE